jgi:iron complex transport system permease protein
MLILINILFIFLALFLRGGSADLVLLEHFDSIGRQILFQLRLMSVLTSIAVGVSLSIVGLYLQTLFVNPLASPFTLGVSPMSSLFISIFIFLGSQFYFFDHVAYDSVIFYLFQLLFSLIGAIITFLLILRLQNRFSNVSLMILIGVMLGSFAGALQQLLEIFMNREQLQMNFFWNMGTFDISSFRIVLLLLLTAFITFYMFFKLANKSDLFLLGEIYSQSMGLNLNKYLFRVLTIASIAIAIVVTFCGPIGFVGLIAPHIAKSIVRSNRHHILLSITALIGSALSLFSLWISHWSIFETTVPINIILSMIGVPYTFYIILKQKNGL